jgi:uncharacterized protein (TIGR02646 family)
MTPFRDKTPTRRSINTAVASYRDHKENLQIDFNHRCGYCNAIDSWKLTYFEIDHFIPEAILTIKTNTDYSNLVYACRSCNNAKRKQWPTNDENVPNQNDEGFIDPCEKEYADQFYRSLTGEIKYQTKLGQWIYFSLKLHKPQHKIIWNLEQLDEIIEEMEKLSKSIENEQLSARLLGLYRKYRDYVKQFKTL